MKRVGRVGERIVEAKACAHMANDRHLVDAGGARVHVYVLGPHARWAGVPFEKNVLIDMGGHVQADMHKATMRPEQLLLACLWVAMKLEQSRKKLPNVSKVAALLRLSASDLNTMELWLMNTLNWAPMRGWRRTPPPPEEQTDSNQVFEVAEQTPETVSRDETCAVATQRPGTPGGPWCGEASLGCGLVIENVDLAKNALSGCPSLLCAS